MQVFSARVRGGSIVPEEGVILPEGAQVTVIADDDMQVFEVSLDEEAKSLDARRWVDPGL